MISDHLTVHAVQVPDKPLAPITSIIEPNVIVTWTEPYEGDTPILSYTIVFQTVDGDFLEDTLECDGSN